MTKTVKLFHATSIGCVNDMFATGHIGIDRQSYINIGQKIGKKLPMNDQMFFAIFDSVYDSESSESNGGVSFFPTYNQSHYIMNQYCNGGEWLNLFIKRFAKSWYRRNKQKYQPLEITDIIGSTSPAIIEVELPVNLIENYESVQGSLGEHFTVQKVDVKYITNVYTGQSDWINSFADSVSVKNLMTIS